MRIMLVKTLFMLFLCNRSINGKRASEHLFRVPTIFCVVEDTNETRPESIKSSASSDSTKVVFSVLCMHCELLPNDFGYLDHQLGEIVVTLSL